MLISIPKGPDGGDRVLDGAISHLIYDQGRSTSKMGGSLSAEAEAEASAPLQMFLVDLDDIQNTGFLGSAAPAGWRYLIHSKGPVAVADVRTAEGGGVAFSRLVHGTLAENLDLAAAEAQRVYGEALASYEPRILAIPSLYMTALWLHGPTDVFYPLKDDGSVPAEKIVENREFLAEAVSRALLAREASAKKG